jgi:putative SOS response-associated peptidase YedK
MMRYHCRPAGIPASIDRKFPGLYNARRDNLKKFWKNQYGKQHGILVVTSFFENVNLHAAEHRELRPGEEPKNLILQFQPQPARDMYLACVWDRWTAEGEPELLSFAAITDEPPPEVAEAGHDRCVIPIAEKNIDAWLTPEGRSDEELQGILDERERPYYEHKLAA